jgi:hypothetical protein
VGETVVAFPLAVCWISASGAENPAARQEKKANKIQRGMVWEFIITSSSGNSAQLPYLIEQP